MAYKLLDGIRILDLTMVFAGPVSTKILAELGAEVIKIESIQRADVFTRANVYPENEPGEDYWNRGCLFHTLNAGKKGISLNLGSEQGKEIFKRLVKISDAVVENYSPRVMENWGLGYEELKKIKSDIIMVSVSGLGHYGPLKDFYMYVPGMEGMSGLTYITGFPGEPPLLSGCAYGDWVTGANAAAALLTALYYHMQTGEGQYIDISGREAVACHIGEILTGYTLNKENPSMMGNRHAYAAPHGCYRCKGEDSWVNIAVENDIQWQNFCKVIGSPVWTTDEKFATIQSRWQNQDELDMLVEEWTIQHDHIEIMQTLQEVGIAAGAVLNMKEININPHLIDRGFFQIIDHGAGLGKRPIASQMPAKFSESKSFVPKRAPRFAEDDEYVFGSLLKMSKAEMEKLAEEKIIGGPPNFPRGRPTRTDLIEEQKAGWFDPDYLNELREKHGEDIGKYS
jgi:crotonobetainyl-CoA:carnitine CoA-transferase CaiB-like acyl-CoA transferase